MRPRAGQSPARGRVARRAAIAALLITGAVNMLHYARLIAVGYALWPGHPEAYRDLQQAATWADGWMGLMALAGGMGVWLDRDWGRLLGIVAASALVHMGFLDVAFHAQHGMYTSLDPVMLEMIVVDCWAFGVGASLILYLWSSVGEGLEAPSNSRLRGGSPKWPE